MMNLAALLFPDLALIALGWLLRRFAPFPTAFWEGAESLVYHVLFPALLFGAIARSPLAIGTAAPVVAAAYGALAVGIVLSYVSSRLPGVGALQFASGAQCGFRFNSYLTLSLAARVGEAPGLALAALIVGFIVPVANMAAVFPLARHAGGSFWRALARNPLVLATVGGLFAQALGVRMPEAIDATLLRMGQASLALGLLCVGASLKLGVASNLDAQARLGVRTLGAWLSACKLLAMPATAWLLAGALGLNATERLIVVMFAAMPTSPASHVLASRMGGDGQLAAQLVTISTLAAALSLPLWMGLAGASSR